MELLKRMKRQDEQLPVVMMTAHGNVDGAVEAMKAGAIDFLTKPLDYVALFALIEATATELRRAHAGRSLDARVDRESGAGRSHWPQPGDARGASNDRVARVERCVGDSHG